MPREVRAVVVDPDAPGRLVIKPVELRDPDRDEVSVRVTAISLNDRRPQVRAWARSLPMTSSCWKSKPRGRG